MTSYRWIRYISVIRWDIFTCNMSTNNPPIEIFNLFNDDVNDDVSFMTHRFQSSISPNITVIICWIVIINVYLFQRALIEVIEVSCPFGEQNEIAWYISVLTRRLEYLFGIVSIFSMNETAGYLIYRLLLDYISLNPRWEIIYANWNHLYDSNRYKISWENKKIDLKRHA